MYDRFVQYPVADAGDGRAGLVRLDLSEIDKEGRVAWSTFFRLPEGCTDEVFGSVMQDKRFGYLVSLDAGTGAARTWQFSDATGAYEHGWLQSSYVRYGTLEEKSFHSVKVVSDAPVTTGRIRVSANGESGSPWQVGFLDKVTGHESEMSIGARSTLTSLMLIFDLFPDDGTQSDAPHLEAWRLKALPNDKDRAEQVLLPMLNFDFEYDQYGVRVGQEGRAWIRWKALVRRLTGVGSLQIHELNSGAIYTATVEDCSFTQVAPPERASGFGGIIQLVLKADQTDI
jgi:hypothetical protein